MKAILLRNSGDHDDEEEVISRYFKLIKNRWEISHYQLDMVIPRYSSLPYFNELYVDCEYFGKPLIHSYVFHRWIANFDWYESLKPFTPYSWVGRDALEKYRRSGFKGPVVLKGATNSKKLFWSTRMYAETYDDVRRIASELNEDNLIGYQSLVIREYIPLVTFATGINNIRYTKEFRLFYVGRELVAGGYYWSTAPDEIVEANQEVSGKAVQLGNHLANLVCAANPYEKTPFFVLDVAQKEDGDWILVEINDGTCAGLSEINPDHFYERLSEVL